MKPTKSYNGTARSQSTRDLHNIREEKTASPEIPKRGHKSMLNISNERERSPRISSKPPVSPSTHGRMKREVNQVQKPIRRKKLDGSPGESSTEGDSSQQSQRSIVYLHAATG